MGTGQVDSPLIDAASADLRRGPAEPGLSVYRVEQVADAHEMAVRFALTCRNDVVHADFLVFPDEVATDLGLKVITIGCEGLEPTLNARHQEILGLTEDLTRRLAESILRCPDVWVERIPKRDLPNLGADLCRRDPTVREYLTPLWAGILAPLLDDPPSDP